MSKVYNYIKFRNLKPDGKLTQRARLFIGYKCNISCKFCFYRGMKGIDIKPLIWQQLKQGYRYGLKDWDISGGEPSILPYWFDLLSDMSAAFRKIAVVTNGYKFAKKDFMRNSLDCGLNEILFSLHGSTPEVHDSLTGVKGSWGKIMRAVENAQEFLLPIRINTVITKDNYKDISNIARLCKHIKPVAFNFLPFRIENSADAQNSISYTFMSPYIKTSIDIFKESLPETVIAVRYLPFCVLENYERYVEGFLQKSFDSYEWNEYCVSAFENARRELPIPDLDCKTQKWKLELESLNKSITYFAGHTFECNKCKYLYICDGIWKGYADKYGTKEFKPVLGKKTYSIIEGRNQNV